MVRWRAAVDRLEGGLAVLVPLDRPEARFVLDSALLPAGLNEGAVLNLRIELDPEAGQARRREISELQRELEGGTP